MVCSPLADWQDLRRGPRWPRPAHHTTAFRALCRRLGYHWVTRQKNKDINPGKSFRRRLEKRDLSLQRPDWNYVEKARSRRYEVWEEREEGHRYRFVFARRTTLPALRARRGQPPPKVSGRSQEPEVHQGACLTDLPADKAPAAAVAMIMETRWWIEDTGFHEQATPWGLDRPYVHVGRPVAVTAILILAFVAYNAIQAFFYRELGISPQHPECTIGHVCRLLLISSGALGRKASGSAAEPEQKTPGPGWPPGPDP